MSSSYIFSEHHIAYCVLIGKLGITRMVPTSTIFPVQFLMHQGMV